MMEISTKRNGPSRKDINYRNMNGSMTTRYNNADGGGGSKAWSVAQSSNSLPRMKSEIHGHNTYRGPPMTTRSLA